MKHATWLQTKPIAHRGLWNEHVPENSLGAFQRAVENSMPIELDVQMLCDGTMIIFHDWSLIRMCGAHKNVCDMTIKEISSYTLASSDECIPSLHDVLHLVRGRVPLLIEMKNKKHMRHVFIKNLHEVLEGYEGAYALSSFDPFLVKKTKEIFPLGLCGQNFSDYPQRGIIGGIVRKIGMYGAWMVSRYVPDFFVCHATMLPQCWIVRVAKKYNKPMLLWGKIRQRDYDHIMQIVDNVIIDPK